MMENKTCLGCGKVMRFEDYKLYNNYSESCFLRRKWCSEKCRLRNCSQNQAERKKWNLEIEHHQKIIKANEIIKGEIVGINAGNKKNNPDITKDNKDYEIEMVGNHAFVKFKKKYTTKNKQNSLVICLKNGIYPLFNEIYLMKENGEFIKIK